MKHIKTRDEVKKAKAVNESVYKYDDNTWKVMRYDKFGMWGHRAPVAAAR